MGRPDIYSGIVLPPNSSTTVISQRIRQLGQRKLGRRMARRALQEASRAVEQLLEAADRGVERGAPG